MHWLTMKLRRVVPATELFTTFRKGVLQADPAPDVGDLIRELCRDAGIMRSFDDQPEGSIEATFFERLQDLDTTTVLPLVLYLFSCEDVSVDCRRRSLRVLESWLVRRICLRLTAKDYNQQVAALLGKVADDPGHADEAILRHLRAAAGQVNRWPTDEEMLEVLTTRDTYGNIAQYRLAMLFRAVERTLYTSKTEALAVPKGLSIEHLMPQAWEDNWPLPECETVEEQLAAAEQRNLHIHRLGNLTVVTPEFNSSLSNSSWDVKHEEIANHSKLLLNADVVRKHPQVFDESSIDTRSRLLAERICRIWPGPDAAAWPVTEEEPASETQ